MSPSTPPVLPGQLAILLIEDDDALRGLARLILATHGFDVTEAGDGEEAVRLAGERAGWPDLIVADVRMRGMGGVTAVCRVLVRHPSAKVRFLSGHDFPAGAAVVRKPFSPAELLAKFQAVLAG